MDAKTKNQPAPQRKQRGYIGIGNRRVMGTSRGDTTPGGAASAWLLEDGTSGWLLEDGTSYWLLEG